MKQFFLTAFLRFCFLFPEENKKIGREIFHIEFDKNRCNARCYYGPMSDEITQTEKQSSQNNEPTEQNSDYSSVRSPHKRTGDRHWCSCPFEIP
ncbi:hypothetical protein CDAR_102051 [Caerostris darwini]|uniref:Secreted protein n=1 Tax=Caerostris darwini TaxID=1538125 RepID=A0AAV4MEF7_9ARAC|nr:hypothetical protein CDAR_102051 [Caerostris darwini]